MIVYQKLWCVFDIDVKEKQIVELEKETSKPDFWNHSQQAQSKMRRLSVLRTESEQWRELQTEANAINELANLALEEQDDSLTATLEDEVRNLRIKLNELEFNLVLSGEYDRRDAIVALHAGAGGVDSQDWVEMLTRMYTRWAENKGYDTQVLDISSGEQAGFKSAVMQLSGQYAYGYMKGERGVHRLVRLSPFDADHARHTSFALVEVLPEAESGIDVTVNTSDLKIDVFRAGGAGGQSVQKNSTAVRITHLPTGIKVSCQNERSQYQNKTIAMKILLARLMEFEMIQHAAGVAKLKGDHISAEWGNQIRSYVLHPYKMVKDHRTNHETSDAESVLHGGIDEFVKSYLTYALGDQK